MKTIKLLSFAFMVLTFASCSKDEEADNSGNPSNSENSIQRTWSQTMMANGLAGYQEFELGEILWTFDSNNQVTLEYNIPMSEIEQSTPIEPGTYNYTIEDAPELDGPRMIFEKL